MWLALLAVLHLSQAQNDCLTHPSFRQPDPSDIKVFCGSERVELEVLLCPAYFNGYNESLMALNSQNRDECKGLLDWTVDPPVLRFTIGLRAISTCANVLTITKEKGEGALSDYSNIQYLNIEGMVNSIDTSGRDISYLQAILYKFSCCYPLLYLVEKNEMSIAAVSLAVQDKNGSFVSTLSMKLFADHTYTDTLQIPNNGLELKTRVFVEVKAYNLTNRFNVLLDRCYATPTPFAMSSTYYNLFIGCDRGDQTILHVNGLQQDARFSFETFRFVQHENRTLSTFYIHCATRLCESSTCSSLIQNCSSTTNRRRRRADDTESTSVSDEATVTSGPISIHARNVAHRTQENGAVLGIVIIIWIFGILYPDSFHQLSQL